MELRRESVSLPDRRAERRRVVRFRRDQLLLYRLGVVTVHEVDCRLFRNTAKQWAIWLREAERVPAHVRHLQRQIFSESDHLTWEKIQPRVLTIFVALGEQHLHAQADAQEGPLSTNVVADQLIHAGLANQADGIAKRSHAWQDQLRSRADLMVIPSDYSLRPDMLECLLHAAKVRHSVVDNRNLLIRVQSPRTFLGLSQLKSLDLPPGQVPFESLGLLSCKVRF